MLGTKEVKIVRWTPPNALYERRELRASDFEAMGILNQEADLVFTKETNNFIRLDQVEVSDEALAYLEDPKNWHMGESFSVETQTVKVKDEPTEEGQVGESPDADNAETEGSQPTGSPAGSSTGSSTTTQSTGTTGGRRARS